MWMEEWCFTLHRCSSCGELCVCETFKPNCPWFLAVMNNEDGVLAGAMCLKCMERTMQGMQIWADEHLDEDDGA
jgi:hypothetical protein